MFTASNKTNRTANENMMGLHTGVWGVLIIAVALLLNDTVLPSSVDEVPTTISIARDVPSSAVDMQADLTTNIAETIKNGKPTMLLFAPVHHNDMRHVWDAAWLAQALEAKYQGDVDVLVVPVRSRLIGDINSLPATPEIYWDFELVEQYATWLPEFTLTDAGWGLEATTATLINDAGQVLYIGDTASVDALIDETWEKIAVVK